jgi:serine/threonine-protein kinase
LGGAAAPALCPNCRRPTPAGQQRCAYCGALLSGAKDLASAYTVPYIASAILPPNALLHGRYTIARWVGGGGMGAVYEAWDNHIHGRRVAVKELNAATIPNPQDVYHIAQMFQQEAQMLAHLNHPNLPRVSDFFAEGSKQYLVMDFIIGRTLEKLLEENHAPLSEAQVVGIGIQLCNVLEYLHACQPPIIFRDLKPANIMLDNTNCIKLIDFGIARLYKPGKAADTSSFGSAGYAPPEQYGHGQTDARSDIYGLCVTLYHLLTRYDPALNPFALPPLRQLNPGVSPALDAIITRGMQPNANQRWQSAREMRTALSQYRPAAQGAGVSTSRPTTRLLLKVAELSNAQLAVGLALSLALVIASAWFLAPVLVEYSLIWDNVDFIAIIAPLVYAALRRRYVTGAAHALVAAVGSASVWMSVHHRAPLERIVIVALLTGVFVEGWLWLLARVKGRAPDAWQREVAWLALMAVIATAALRALIADPTYGLRVGLWIVSALLGGAGWFIGDLAQQYLFLKQQGFRRVGHF